MHGTGIIITFLAGLTGALIFGYLAKRFNTSPIIGYLLAGIAVGPFTPGFAANYEVATEFAEIGVILLLFGIGLRFELKELLAVWHIALPGALLQSAASTVLTALLLHLFGWSWGAGFILGAAISVASTVVMSLVLKENHDLYTPIGHIAIGWTVVEDILTVMLLLLLPILFGNQNASTSTLGSTLGIALLKIIILIPVMLFISRWIIPWLFKKIEQTHSNELFTLAVIVSALGIAALSNAVFGVSMALGAFLAGLAVGRSDYALRAAGESMPIKDIFSVLFFVSVGMLVNPRAIIETPALIGIVLLVVVFGKPVIATMVVRILGKPFSTAIPVGAAFSQIGEFSFILGTVARNLNLIDDKAWNIMAVVSIISIVLNPQIYKLSCNLSKKINRITLPENNSAEQVINPKQCIIVGYGPVGKIVHQLLAEQAFDISIIELNLATVRKLHNHGYNAIYGDVLRQGVLEEAHISTAGSLILTADIKDSSVIIKEAKKHNPELKIYARCGSLYDAKKLRKAGATVVATGEAEIGVALVEAIADANNPGMIMDAEKRIVLRNTLYETIDWKPKKDPKHANAENTVTFSSALAEGVITIDLKARTKDEAIQEIITKSSKHPKIKNKEEFYHRIMEREQIANTYIDHGLAIPHARTNAVSDISVSLAISRKGIDWQAPDDALVYIIVVLGAQKSFGRQYLLLLSRIVTIFNDPETIIKIKSCTDSNNFMTIIRDREKKLNFL
jgi:CPA2 family monovalent cation:H+ antiporter-2